MKAKVDKNRFCILNFNGLFAMNPKLLGKINTKSGQEMQREARKDKTINEVTDVFKKQTPQDKKT